ncbi:MAG TPA: TerC family protein [Candidatus Krumholzibacteria bacterium]|nr:TerC family protein [Candidatus Krumholzibacteria bacterium]
MDWFLIGFLVFVLSVLALDLGVFHRHARIVPMREALAWTSVWISLALLFGVLVYFMYDRHWLGMGLQPGHETSGQRAFLQYLTGYIVEESLSLDNVFVIALIFDHFKVPTMYQHRVLFWGILGAIVLRGIMIAAGIALIRRFEWIILVFGVFLVFTAIRMIFAREEKYDPEKDILFRLARRVYPVSPRLEGEKFFTRVNGRHAITPLFLVLLVVDSADTLFAVDSIPAIFAITQDPFIVFTSNIFAILGLRSMYFLMAGAMEKFRYLKTSLAFVLAFVGIKMLLSHYVHLPIAVSLGVILGILFLGILASLVASKREARRV